MWNIRCTFAIPKTITVMRTLSEDFMIDHEIVVAVINGVKVYYSPDRIEKKNVPAGFHRYEIRSSDDGKKWSTLENFVGVNFAGTVLSETTFKFDQEFKFPCQPTSRWLDIVSYSVEDPDDEDEWDDDDDYLE